jgi:hypothetical protein
VKAIAWILDLSERRVRQLREEGVIAERDGHPGLYELIPTARRYINFLRKRNPDSGENLDYNTERSKLVRAKRLNEEYELKIREGELHTSADIEAAMSSMLMNFKSRLTAMPAKLSPVLSKKTGKTEIFKIIKENIDEALNELSDFDRVFVERGAGGEGGDA